jgi:hypothetical protein
MKEISRRTLIGKVGKLIGFAFDVSPLSKKDFVELVIYRTATEYVMCHSGGPLAGISIEKRAELQREGLGMHVPAALFAPFAQRSVGLELSYDDLKKICQENFPQTMKFEWLEESPKEGA